MNLQAKIDRIDQLSEREKQYWQGFRRENPVLASPYFSYEFAALMARARNDTRVLTLSQNGTLAGFLPFHLSRTGVSRPLGGPLGDHHGLITTTPELDLQTAWKQAGLGVLVYHGALASQGGFAANAETRQSSWVVNMEAGFDAYWEGRRQAEAKSMRNIRARDRKLQAASSDIVYRVEDNRAEALDSLLQIKRAQYAQTRATDVFKGRWARTLIHDLMGVREAGLAGVLSTLEIDGRLAAAHFGMRSQSVLHYWFPVYDPAFSQFSPGLLLFRELARELSMTGITRIDLGPGDFDFKHRLSNDAFDITGGRIASASLSSAALALGNGIDRFAQSLPLGRASHWPGKALRRLDSVVAVRAI